RLKTTVTGCPASAPRASGRRAVVDELEANRAGPEGESSILILDLEDNLPDPSDHHEHLLPVPVPRRGSLLTVIDATQVVASSMRLGEVGRARAGGVPRGGRGGLVLAGGTRARVHAVGRPPPRRGARERVRAHARHRGDPPGQPPGCRTPPAPPQRAGAGP